MKLSNIKYVYKFNKGEFMFEIISHNEIETKEIACKLASKLSHGDIVVLSGDLGSGKTKFTEGFLSFWGLEDEISSPTFTIVNEYTSNDVNIYHFDVYRLEDSEEFLAIGGLEYFENGICIIEWGELIKDILPNNYIQIIFSKDSNNENIRYLKFNIVGEKIKETIKELFNK